MTASLAAAALAAGRTAGLNAIGIAPATPFESTRVDLESRRAAGLHGEMAFTYRNPARSTDPARVLDGAQALVVGALRYPAPPDESRRGQLRARVARYARADHYERLRSALGAVARVLTDDGFRARVVADDNALVDREAARRAGIGWYGKNANLLLPGQGSWFVLGSVVTDAPLPTTTARAPDGCGTCTRCIDGCPTGAIVSPGVIDARRCIAWLLQAPGPIPVALRSAIGDRIYGCDECQEVCPPNRRRRDEPGPDDGATLDVLWLLTASDDALLARCGRWYIPDRDVDALRRNALVVLGNTADPGAPEVTAALTRYLTHPNPILREHAAWAAGQLGRVDLIA